MPKPADNSIPPISAELLALLDERWPDRLPRDPLTIEELRRAQGRRDVVDFIRHHFDKQNNSIIKGR